VLKRGVAWRDVERPPREDLLRDVMPRGVFDLDRVILGSTLVGAWLFWREGERCFLALRTDFLLFVDLTLGDL